MEITLVMFRSEGDRRKFPLLRDMTVIGRREDCDLRIPLAEVSRKHCRFVRDGDVLKLEDLGSSNGTYHNGMRVQEILLEPGDTVQVGPIPFVVQIDGEPLDENLSPIISANASDPAAAGSGAPTEVTSPTSAELEEIPAELEEIPAELEEVPAELDEAPVELEEVSLEEDTPSETEAFDPMSALEAVDDSVGNLQLADSIGGDSEAPIKLSESTHGDEK